MLVPDIEAKQQGSKVRAEASAAQMNYLGGEEIEDAKSINLIRADFLN
jgi:hypothetical protein